MRWIWIFCLRLYTFHAFLGPVYTSARSTSVATNVLYDGRCWGHHTVAECGAMEPEESVAFACLVYFYNGRHDVRYNGRILCARVASAAQTIYLSILEIYVSIHLKKINLKLYNMMANRPAFSNFVRVYLKKILLRLLDGCCAMNGCGSVLLWLSLLPISDHLWGLQITETAPGNNYHPSQTSRHWKRLKRILCRSTSEICHVGCLQNISGFLKC
jgi:hypothetical protein